MYKNFRTFHSGSLAAIFTTILFFAPQAQALASNGPSTPFDDPIWQALVGLAVLINGFLYFLVCRRRAK